MKSFIYTNLKREEEGKPRLEWYLRDVALAVRHPKTCRAILNRHDELAHYIQFLERENNEVLVTVLSHIIPFETIAALWDKQDLFSLVDWRDRNDQGVLLFGNDSESQGPITTMNSFLIERLFQVARNDSTRSGKHTAIFLDEVSNLDKLNGLDTITATGRDFGISMFLGFQSFSAMKAKYGEDIANKILNELSHRAYLRGEKGHVQWVSEQLGMREVRERTPSDGSSISWTKDGLTTGTQDGNSWPLKDAPVVKEGLIKTLSETNERNGLTGFFSSLKVTKGPWKHHYEWWDFREAIRTCSEPKKQPRHAREQILREWDILDYARLDLEVPVSLKPKGSNFKPPTKSKSLPSSPAPLQLPAAPEEQPPDAPKRKRPFKRW
jgi:hypothetical protein